MTACNCVWIISDEDKYLCTRVDGFPIEDPPCPCGEFVLNFKGLVRKAARKHDRHQGTVQEQ